MKTNPIILYQYEITFSNMTAELMWNDTLPPSLVNGTSR